MLVSEGLVLALRDGYPVSRGHSPARRDSLDHSGEGRLLERQGQMSAPPGDRGQLDFLQHVQRISGGLAQAGPDDDFVERRAQAAALVFLQEPQLEKRLHVGVHVLVVPPEGAG